MNARLGQPAAPHPAVSTSSATTTAAASVLRNIPSFVVRTDARTSGRHNGLETGTPISEVATSTSPDRTPSTSPSATEGIVAKPAVRKRVLKWAIAIVGLGVLLYLGRDLDTEALVAAITDIDPRFGIAAALLVVVGKIGAKVIRSQILLVEECRRVGCPAPTLRTTARLLVASHAAGQLAWGPLGFTVRTLALRDGGMPLLSVARVHIVERIAEAIGIAVIAVAVLVIAPEAVLGSWFGRILLGVLGLAALVGLIAIVSRRLRSLFAQHAGAGRALAKSTAWAFASSLADVGVLWLVAHGMGVDLDLGTVLLAFLAVNGVGALPLTPAQIGVQEGSIVVVLAAAGIAAAPALAVALAYRAAHVVPLVLVGLPALLVTWLRRAPSRKP
jgi:uncharacterized membrane protein YbhN (UPF0104 family)